jgi:hypothetical protein
MYRVTGLLLSNIIEAEMARLLVCARQVTMMIMVKVWREKVAEPCLAGTGTRACQERIVEQRVACEKCCVGTSTAHQ